MNPEFYRAQHFLSEHPKSDRLHTTTGFLLSELRKVITELWRLTRQRASFAKHCGQDPQGKSSREQTYCRISCSIFGLSGQFAPPRSWEGANVLGRLCWYGIGASPSAVLCFWKQYGSVVHFRRLRCLEGKTADRGGC